MGHSPAPDDVSVPAAAAAAAEDAQHRGTRRPRTALAEARLTDADGRLYAHATSSCLIFRPGG